MDQEQSDQAFRDSVQDIVLEAIADLDERTLDESDLVTASDLVAFAVIGAVSGAIGSIATLIAVAIWG